MAKLSVYVPDALRERMDAVGEVNWSKVAATAFEKEVLKLERSRAMGDVIERLRASRNNVDFEERQAGAAEGREWAERRAEYDELQRLAEILQSEWDFEDAPGGAFSASEHLACAISGVDTDRRTAGDFWEHVGHGYDNPPYGRPAYLRAFAEAAVEVFEQVRDQLDE
jgi:hypothetical protein